MKDKIIYIHIPKTGGTALKTTIKEGQHDILDYQVGHGIRLASVNQAFFVVRDPFDRFCSAFYERKTQEQRHTHWYSNKDKYRGQKPDVLLGGEPNKLEQLLLLDVDTPDQLMTKIRENPDEHGWILHYPLRRIPCMEVFGSMAVWLGDLASYKQNEHKVKYAIEQKALSRVMKEEFGIDLTTEPFLARKLTTGVKDYRISPTNREWFKNVRPHDFQLCDYIRTRPYYRR